MNKKQKTELEQMREKWSLDSTLAVSDITSYVLDRARKDYEKVMGTGTGTGSGSSGVGLAKWQSECLTFVAGVGTPEEIAVSVTANVMTEVIETVQEVFEGYSEGTVTAALGQTVIEKLCEIESASAVGIELLEEVVTGPIAVVTEVEVAPEVEVVSADLDLEAVDSTYILGDFVPASFERRELERAGILR